MASIAAEAPDEPSAAAVPVSQVPAVAAAGSAPVSEAPPTPKKGGGSSKVAPSGVFGTIARQAAAGRRKSGSSAPHGNTLILKKLFAVDLQTPGQKDEWKQLRGLMKGALGLSTLSALKSATPTVASTAKASIFAALDGCRRWGRNTPRAARLLSPAFASKHLGNLVNTARMTKPKPLHENYYKPPKALANARTKLRALSSFSQGRKAALSPLPSADDSDEADSHRQAVKDKELDHLAATAIQRVYKGHRGRLQFGKTKTAAVLSALAHWKGLVKHTKTTRDKAAEATFQRELRSINMTEEQFDDVVIGHHEETILEFPELKELITSARREERVRLAASFIEDAMRFKPMRTYRLGPWPIYIYRLVNDPWVQGALFAIVLLHCALCGWEPPTNMDTDRVDEYRASDTYTWVSLLDVMICLIHTWMIALEVFHMSLQRYVKKPHLVGKAVVVGLMLVDALWEASNATPILRLARILRPLLLIDHSIPLRRTVPAILSAMPYFMDVLLFMGFLIAAFAVIGMYLFRGMYVDEEGNELPENFNDFLDASLAMFVCFSKDNHPFIVKPVADEMPYAWPFFLFALVVSIYIIGAIPVSVIFEAFREHRKKQVVGDRINERRALLTAFAMLDADNSGHLDQSEWSAVVSQLLGSHRLDEANRWFTMIDADCSCTVDSREFFEVCEVMFWADNNQSRAFFQSALVRETLPGFQRAVNRRLHLDKLVLGAPFKLLVATFVLVDVAFLASQSDDWWYTEDADYAAVRQAFLSFYVLEVALGAFALGPFVFWESWWNQVDVGLNVLTLTTELLLIERDVPLMMLLFSRISRWARHFDIFNGIPFLDLSPIAAALNRTHQMVSNVVVIMPSVLAVLSVFAILFQVYAVIGMELYSEVWTTERGFDSVGNFGSYASAMLALFTVCISNAWSVVLHDAFLAKDGSRWNNSVAALFFISFFLLSAVVLTNLILALVYEIFSVVASEKLQSYSDVRDKVEEENPPPAAGADDKEEIDRRNFLAAKAGHTNRSMDVRVFSPGEDFSVSEHLHTQ